ncbi:hypothetical protein RF11_13040 [Thelohanellus kitauei]|uniref:ISXO2-like transposase domain-containing protein n=1 Tax=Thelohanellus kitauei TaxID=669202 RepID=A0A0C2NDU6_THEKT|nr:hypothetical protein RF11_13040 [Thelohanellus kitauei]
MKWNLRDNGWKPCNRSNSKLAYDKILQKNLSSNEHHHPFLKTWKWRRKMSEMKNAVVVIRAGEYLLRVECHITEDGSYISNGTGLFKVDRQKRETLMLIIQEHVLEGSLIWRDEWAAHNAINNGGSFQRGSVDHSQNFISQTGVHTQNVKRMWSQLRLKLVKNMRGTSE